MVTLGIISTFLLFAVIFLFFVTIWRNKIGIPSGDIAYSDSKEVPGEILYSNNIPLIGKPDFIIKKNGFYIPIEVKTGKTPKMPYPNHLAQLYAYCLLVEENFHVRPPYAILRYPENEFILEFPEQTENYLTYIVNQLIEKKQQGLSREGLTKVCKNCKDHIQLLNL